MAAASVGLAQKVRHFSTSLVRPASKLVQPPIQVYGLEGRYATALYSAASKQKKLENVEKELTRVLTLIKDPKLSAVVMNPHVKGSVKQKTVNDVLLKEKLSPMTVNFFNVLAENGRLSYTPSVISAFGRIMSAHRGEVLCSVTTAQALDEASITELKTTLNGFLAKGEVLKLETKLEVQRDHKRKNHSEGDDIDTQLTDKSKDSDSSILGGMIVSIGDKYIDMSTKTKIQKLTKIMKETV